MAKKIIVVGDVIIDRFTYCSPLKLSAETPTIVGSYEKQETYVGGAGLVARHLVNLGAEVQFITPLAPMELVNLQAAFIGTTDPVTREESARLNIVGVETDGWKMNRKDRFFVGPYKIFQMDNLNKLHHDRRSTEALMAIFMDHIVDADLVLICDNRHGALTDEIYTEIVDVCTDMEVPFYVDAQTAFYGGVEPISCSGIFMNEEELGDEDPLDLSHRLLGTKLLVKRGSAGAELYLEGKLVERADGIQVEAVDTCGAGDAFLAAYSVHDSLEKANEYAAKSVTLKGTRVHAPSVS
ncbi:MAG: PfkB family carbohydrate kinase [Acidiferrobacterales bacterium]